MMMTTFIRVFRGSQSEISVFEKTFLPKKSTPSESPVNT